MTLHVILAVVATAASLVVIAAAVLFAVAGRRSGGRRDHRWAVDRAVLGVPGGVFAAGLAGLLPRIGVIGSRYWLKAAIAEAEAGGDRSEGRGE